MAIFLSTSLDPNTPLNENDDQKTFHHIRCGGKKVKTKNLCAYQAQETLVSGYLTKRNFLYVYDKCDDDSKCVPNYENGDWFDYKCSALPVKREHGDSCKYNGECFSRNCRDGKCRPVDDGYPCLTKNDNQCRMGSYCAYEAGDSYLCRRMSRQDETCTSNKQCRLGLSCYKGKCIRWGYLAPTTQMSPSDDPELCQSGMVAPVQNERGEVTYECAEVREEGRCPQYEEGKVFLALNRDISPREYPCEGHYGVDGLKNYLPPFIKYTTTAFKEFMKDYEDMKPYKDDFYKGDKYIGERGGFGKYKTRIKYVKYKFAKDLIGRKMIDMEGNIKNKCEFNFYIKQLSSSFINYNIVISILLLFGLIL